MGHHDGALVFGFDFFLDQLGDFLPSKLLLSEEEKLEVFKQIVRSIKQVLATVHTKGEGL